MQVGTGKSVLNGIAIGKLKIYKKKDTAISTAPVADTAAELERFEAARQKAIEQQTALYEKALAEAQRISRDNARTPMQWDDSANAGFTTGTPWIKVGPDYETVNAKNEMADPDSVYNYYKKLIHLRKEKDIMVYGTYELLDPEDEALYVYTRTLGDQKLLVMCNFTKEEQEYTVPETFAGAEVLISNYPQDGAAAGVRKLRAYEAVVLETK